MSKAPAYVDTAYVRKANASCGSLWKPFPSHSREPDFAVVVGYASPASAPHAVTGGSGQFVGATGQVVLSNTPYAANTTAGDMYFDVTLY